MLDSPFRRISYDLAYLEAIVDLSFSPGDRHFEYVEESYHHY